MLVKITRSNETTREQWISLQKEIGCITLNQYGNRIYPTVADRDMAHCRLAVKYANCKFVRMDRLEIDPDQCLSDAKELGFSDTRKS